MKPEELLFRETHEWLQVTEVDGEKVGVVGLSAFAVEALTDLVFMELPEIGAELQPGDSFGEVESVKAVSDLYSPAAGEVIEVNSKLPSSLELLSKDPYGEGWMIKIKLSADPGDDLMDYAAYQKHCEQEQH